MNAYGTSAASDSGNGAQIQLVPDAPINLLNVWQITDADQTGLDWDPGNDDGGSPVIDYRVWWSLETGSFDISKTQDGITTDYWTTNFPTLNGRIYKYKV